MRKFYYIILPLFTFQLYAGAVSLEGTYKQTVQKHTSKSKFRTFAQNDKIISKQVYLLRLGLSENSQATLKHRLAHHEDTNLLNQSAGLPREVQLGMNGVPVLDQGSHNTCVTFAVTAAIDAALEKGDYVSQLCSLQLGNYLEENGLMPSGWDGSLGKIVLSQISLFGFVNKKSEKENGCGGFYEYLRSGPDPITQIPVDKYSTIMDRKNSKIINWSALIDIDQAFNGEISTQNVLKKVKLSLQSGDRISFGTILASTNRGVVGATGKHKSEYDTWILTEEIIEELQIASEFAGHEMVITGYSDDAIAVDENGHKHKGLLTIRNSWGDKIGDNGNFYMSYNYFAGLVLEAYRLRKDETASD